MGVGLSVPQDSLGNKAMGGPGTRRTLTMSWLNRTFRVPANESHVGVVLAFCILTMSLMTVALIWQAQVIAHQREAIRWLESLKFGG